MCQIIKDKHKQGLEVRSIRELTSIIERSRTVKSTNPRRIFHTLPLRLDSPKLNFWNSFSGSTPKCNGFFLGSSSETIWVNILQNLQQKTQKNPKKRESYCSLCTQLYFKITVSRSTLFSLQILWRAGLRPWPRFSIFAHLHACAVLCVFSV